MADMKIFDRTPRSLPFRSCPVESITVSPTPVFLMTNDLALQAIDMPYAAGLNAATGAILDAQTEITPPLVLAATITKYTANIVDIRTWTIAQKNRTLAGLVRTVAKELGWIAGWVCLAITCPSSNLHLELIEDVQIGVDVYDRLDILSRAPSYIDDIQFTVTANPSSDTMNEIGPKTIGGAGWKTDEVFKQAAKDWQAPKDFPMGPCPLFGWIGCTKKVPDHMDDEIAHFFWSAQFLATIDYDFDKGQLKGKFNNAVTRVARQSTRVEGKLRGIGWAGLLTMDQQIYNRSVQMKWVKERKGAFAVSHPQMTIEDFATAVYVDCAALMPFAYQPESMLHQSKKGMLVVDMFANMHDLLYDQGCSNRISAAAYTVSMPGVFENDLAQAFLVGEVGRIAKKILDGPEDQVPIYGEHAVMIIGVWSLFNGRYRAWERLIKYTRLLQASSSPVAASILARAKNGMVLEPQNPDAGIGEAFVSALDTKSISKLVPRSSTTSIYTLAHPGFALENHGLTLPSGLCDQCNTSARDAFFGSEDTIQAIPGVPTSYFFSDAVTFAAAIRRLSLFALSQLPNSNYTCCESCACKIAFWTNDVSHKVLIACMQAETKMSAKEWMLLCYVVGCVGLSPLRVISVLTGFDTAVRAKYEMGVMGERDVVDA